MLVSAAARPEASSSVSNHRGQRVGLHLRFGGVTERIQRLGPDPARDPYRRYWGDTAGGGNSRRHMRIEVVETLLSNPQDPPLTRLLDQEGF